MGQDGDREAALRDRCRRDDALEVFGDVEIRLVERQWLDDWCIFGEDIPDLQRDRLVGVEPRFNEYQIGAFALGGDRRHRGMRADRPRFVACGRDDTAFARSADRDRLPRQLRIVTLFDRCVKRIHIDMDDFARGTGLGRGFLHALFGRDLSPLSRWLVTQGYDSREAACPGIGNRWRRPRLPTNLCRRTRKHSEGEWHAIRRRDVLY